MQIVQFWAWQGPTGRRSTVREVAPIIHAALGEFAQYVMTAGRADCSLRV